MRQFNILLFYERSHPDKCRLLFHADSAKQEAFRGKSMSMLLLSMLCFLKVRLKIAPLKKRSSLAFTNGNIENSNLC